MAQFSPKSLIQLNLRCNLCSHVLISDILGLVKNGKDTEERQIRASASLDDLKRAARLQSVRAEVHSVCGKQPQHRQNDTEEIY